MVCVKKCVRKVCEGVLWKYVFVRKVCCYDVKVCVILFKCVCVFVCVKKVCVTKCFKKNVCVCEGVCFCVFLCV